MDGGRQRPCPLLLISSSLWILSCVVNVTIYVACLFCLLVVIQLVRFIPFLVAWIWVTSTFQSHFCWLLLEKPTAFLLVKSVFVCWIRIFRKRYFPQISQISDFGLNRQLKSEKSPVLMAISLGLLVTHLFLGANFPPKTGRAVTVSWGAQWTRWTRWTLTRAGSDLRYQKN